MPFPWKKYHVSILDFLSSADRGLKSLLEHVGEREKDLYRPMSERERKVKLINFRMQDFFFSLPPTPCRQEEEKFQYCLLLLLSRRHVRALSVEKKS